MKKRLRRIIKYLVLLSLILLIIIFFYLFLYTQDIKKTISLNAHPIYILNRDNSGKNNAITHEEMSEQFLLAVVAAEDPNHFDRRNSSTLSCFTNPILYLAHPKYFGNADGLSLASFAIRQQADEKYENNLLQRYLYECILTSGIEQSLSKKEIIELYLNETYFLPQQKGVLSASEQLFNKHPINLTLAESIIISGLPQAPTRYDPFNNELNKDGVELWKTRARGILKKMLNFNFINQTEFVEATSELEKITFIQN